jgi:hypothetical protein
VSRTIRRTKTRNKNNCRFEKTYTYIHPNEWCGIELDHFNKRYFPLVKPEEKEFKKLWWKFHSDNGFAIFGWEEAYEMPMHEVENHRRNRYKRELIKWIKNPDYEIQFMRCKQIWDYY